MDQSIVNALTLELKDNPESACEKLMDLIHASARGNAQSAKELAASIGGYIKFLQTDFEQHRVMLQIYHNTVSGMQAAVIAEHNRAGSGMKWIVNGLWGPGQLPEPDTDMTPQEWYDYHHITYCTKTRKYTKSDGGDYDEYNESQ